MTEEKILGTLFFRLITSSLWFLPTTLLEEKRRKLILQSQQQSQQQQQQQQQQQSQTNVFDFLNTTAGITYLESEPNSLNKDNDFIQSILLTDSHGNRQSNSNKNLNEKGNNEKNIFKIEDNEAKLKLKLVSLYIYWWILIFPSWLFHHLNHHHHNLSIIFYLISAGITLN